MRIELHGLGLSFYRMNPIRRDIDFSAVAFQIRDKIEIHGVPLRKL